MLPQAGRPPGSARFLPRDLDRKAELRLRPPEGGTDVDDHAPRDDILLEETVAAGSVVVDEVGSGVVSRMLLHNLGDHPVVLVDGEQLVGARQNRILNTTILVPARTRLEIPWPAWSRGGGGGAPGAWGR